MSMLLLPAHTYMPSIFVPQRGIKGRRGHFYEELALALTPKRKKLEGMILAWPTPLLSTVYMQSYVCRSRDSTQMTSILTQRVEGSDGAGSSSQAKHPLTPGENACPWCTRFASHHMK